MNGDDQSVADLREIQKTAGRSQQHAERTDIYERIDRYLVWVSGVIAGAAGLSAVAQAPPALTAGVAFTSAASSFLAPKMRDIRTYNAGLYADYKRIAFDADQAAKNDRDRDARLKSLNALHPPARTGQTTRSGWSRAVVSGWRRTIWHGALSTHTDCHSRLSRGVDRLQWRCCYPCMPSDRHGGAERQWRFGLIAAVRSSLGGVSFTKQQAPCRPIRRGLGLLLRRGLRSEQRPGRHASVGEEAGPDAHQGLGFCFSRNSGDWFGPPGVPRGNKTRSLGDQFPYRPEEPAAPFGVGPLPSAAHLRHLRLVCSIGLAVARPCL